MRKMVRNMGKLKITFYVLLALIVSFTVEYIINLLCKRRTNSFYFA